MQKGLPGYGQGQPTQEAGGDAWSTTMEPTSFGQGLPSTQALHELLGADSSPLMAKLVTRALVAPARQQLGRERKQLRSQLLRLGYEIAASSHTPTAGEPAYDGSVQQRQLSQACDAIELLHEGSLMIDDIQDASLVRRGAPSMHHVYGVPRTLCTGNWLYFWPLRLFRLLGLRAEQENTLLWRYTTAIERAHYGQALDVGVAVDDIPQPEIAAIARKVAELKTGGITALALEIGAIIAGATPAQLERLGHFGCQFGVALQNFDDLGNLSSRLNPQKRYEDLLLRKPSFVWAFAAESFKPATWSRFRQAVARLPDAAALAQILAEEGLVERASARAQRDLDAAYQLVEEELAQVAAMWRHELHELGERLRHAYA